MSLLVFGSLAFDTIKTPFGTVVKELGGSATYISLAASLFTKPTLLSVVGEDFPQKYFDFFKKKGIDTNWVTKSKSKTFSWSAEYDYDMNTAKTLARDVEIFETYKPSVGPGWDVLYLSNMNPKLQYSVWKQAKPKFTITDSMDYWIEKEPAALRRMISKTDLLLLNEGEARQLVGDPNLVSCGFKLLKMGPEFVILKKGEHGSLLFGGKDVNALPGYPLEVVRDPTGAGDTFGGVLASFIENGGEKGIKQGILYATIVASFCAEGFGTSRLKTLDRKTVETRLKLFRKIVL